MAPNIVIEVACPHHQQ